MKTVIVALLLAGTGAFSFIARPEKPHYIPASCVQRDGGDPNLLFCSSCGCRVNQACRLVSDDGGMIQCITFLYADGGAPSKIGLPNGVQFDPILR